jgi:uncharacterized membrane protein YfcA
MESVLLYGLIRLGLGVIIGFSIGLTGVGGGVLVLPALTLVLGIPPSVAVGTASLYAFLTKCSAVYHHHRLRTVDYRLAALLLMGAVPGNAVASLWVNRLVSRLQPDALLGFQCGLRTFMAVVILLSGVIMGLELVRTGSGRSRATETESAGRAAYGRRTRIAVAVSGGCLVGILIGLTSIGGGVLVVPLLMIVFGLSPSRTVGTSILIAVVLTLLTSVIYGHGGQIDAGTALVMGAGSLLGVYWGSRACAKIPEGGLKVLVTGVILIAGMLMLCKQSH